METIAAKRVAALYRVSTKKQVDKQKDDIPMQKIACQKFSEEKGWIIVRECYEKGISGFKVSANDRDAIQELKEAAIKHEFEVLLVFMFDRLGRIDSETPFVVEWFIQQGIEVWSTQEGQQTLDNQTDKLMNYIRYWQANGESCKTSMRIKTRMAQLTADGIFHGGVPPFGYKLVHVGRMNKKNQPVKDLVVDDSEAEIVRMIFHKTVSEGYGSHRLSEYVNSLGVRTHNGANFQNKTITRILKNKLYCGYLMTGETVSEKIGDLTIIDEDTYNAAQYILEQRNEKNEQKKHIAQTTRGETLLSGNIYCGHCGCHLNAARNSDRVKSETNNGIRYMCYHRARKLNDCDGQSVYSAKRIDDAVVEMVKVYLKKIKQTPKDKALEMRYESELQNKKKQHKVLVAEIEKLRKRLNELSVEVGKSISGESVFTVDVLSMSINATREEMKNAETQLLKCEDDLETQKELLEKLDYYYEQFVSWAEEFDNASVEQKKMILCNLIKAVKVSKGYKIEIEFNISYSQFLSILN
ncbi:MAG: recombinase family protein [Clostridia bacterium]|nr:recombinase family protein [Clostridia bacterium]